MLKVGYAHIVAFSCILGYFCFTLFLVANAVGAAVQITRLYNSNVEQLKNKEDWPRVAASIHLRPMEVSDKQGVFYLHSALGVGQSRQGARVETASADDL